MKTEHFAEKMIAWFETKKLQLKKMGFSPCSAPYRIGNGYRTSLETWNELSFDLLQKVSELMETKLINIEGNTTEGYYGEIDKNLILNVEWKIDALPIKE